MTRHCPRARPAFFGVVAASLLLTGCATNPSDTAATQTTQKIPQTTAASDVAAPPPRSAPVPASASPWPAALFDARHSSNTTATGPQRATVKWTAKLGGALAPGPVIGVDGSILAGSNDGVLHAVDPKTGQDRWIFDGQSGYGSDLSTSPAVLRNGTILWPGPQQTLYALDRRGKLLWTEKLTAQVLSPAVGSNGRVYVADMSGQVVALDVRGSTHQKAWTVSVGGSNYASPAIGPNGQIYTADGDHLVAVEDLGDRGRVAWRFAVRKLIEVSPAVSPDGTIVIGTNNDGLYGVHPDGSRAWRTPINGFIYSSPVIRSDGTGAFGDNPGRVRVFDAKTGAVERAIVPPAPSSQSVWTSVVVDARGNLYWASTAGRLYGYDQQGRQLFAKTLDGPAWGYPALGADGTLYVGTSAGTLYAIGG